MNKITVFWIEDNPIQNNKTKIDGKVYPKLIHSDLFTYCIFQHPKQVREYLSLIHKLNTESSTLAEKCKEALPDIVVFDYKLSEAFKTNTNALSYTDDDHYDFLKSKSASHKLKVDFNALRKKEKLFLDHSDVRNGLYSQDNFKAEIKAGEILSDDEFGLFCGISIVREFKEYIAVGVPATINKADKTTMSYNSIFYEWINSYDLKGAIERPAKPDEMKDWAKILDFSADLLRKRILAQMQLGKITVNLPQLLAWVTDKPSEKEEIEQEKRLFTFESIYGVRHLPLDGLFIDEDVSVRDNAIKTWIKSILSTYQRNISTIDSAINKYSDIYSIFQKYFTDRILLSYFSKKEQDILDLTSKIKGSSNEEECKRLEAEIDNLTNFFTKNNNEYQEEYNRLKEEFEVVDGEITNTSRLCSVQQVYSSFTGNNKKDFPTQEARLLVLLLVTRLWIDYQITNEEKPLYTLDTEDFYNVLNPVVNNNYTGLVLHMHSREGELSLSYYMETFQKYLKNKKYFGINTKSVWSFVWIDDGEKLILKSFFQKELAGLSNKPEWLK
jgi:hypothetical protein